MELLNFRSTRKVSAFKIQIVSISTDFSAKLVDAKGNILQVSSEYVLREKPASGGYYMKDENGFESYITEDLFISEFSEY